MNALSFRYRQVEVALADVLNIKPAGLGAFRARLRHLRNIGLPKLPKPGSGQPITYTWHHALEMLIALELEKVGQSPRNAANLAQSIVRTSGHFQGDDGKEVFVVVVPSAEPNPQYSLCAGLNQILTVVTEGPGPRKSDGAAPRVLSIINVSQCALKLEMALNRAIAAN
jgi:hypothetical protein